MLKSRSSVVSLRKTKRSQAGIGRATEKTNFISELAKKVASPDDLKDSKAVDNIEVVSISMIVLPVKALKIVNSRSKTGC